MRGSSGPPRWRSADTALTLGDAERANGPACTPGSVRGREPRGRSSLSATRCRAAPAAYPGTRRAASTSPVWPCSGRGLPCGSRHRDPGGLLHRRFTLTAAEAEAVCSLWHCLADHSGWVLPTALPCGARTFLGARRTAATRPSSRPIRVAESSRGAWVPAPAQSLSADSAMRTSSGKSIGKSPKSSRAADAAASRTACAASSA